uniref:Uncharacterized protein n=1 Tax=Arundo donax TaxID=35708 RepID=A0A0A9BIK2_ARUDO
MTNSSSLLLLIQEKYQTSYNETTNLDMGQCYRTS